MRTWLLLLGLTIATFAIGQVYPFKNFSVKDGLAHQRVTDAIRDNKGILWVGTSLGLNWYDGTKFTTPALHARGGELYVTRLYKDPQGTIWTMGFYNGIFKYEHNRFTNFLPNENDPASNSNNTFDMVQIAPGKYVVATDNNAFWFDGKKFSLFDKHNPLLASQWINISRLGDDILFINDHTNFRYSYENGNWVNKGPLLPEKKISQIKWDGQSYWIPTSKGLFLYKSRDSVLSDQYEGVYSEGEKIFSLALNHKTGEVWFSSDKLYHLKNGVQSEFTQKNGLPVTPERIYCDDENITWFCTYLGLSKLVDFRYSYHILDDRGFNAFVTTILKEKDGLWIGTLGGLFFKDEFNRFSRIWEDAPDRKAVSWIHRTTTGKLYVGTVSGIAEIIDKKPRWISDALTAKAFEDNEGTLWLVSQNGHIFTLKQTVKQIVDTAFFPEFIDAICRDDYGYVWVGYRSVGIRKYQFRNDSLFPIKNYNIKNGYIDLKIRCSRPDRNGNIIFGTRTNGIFIVSTRDHEKVWQISIKNGLTSNFIKGISIDSSNNIYLATHKDVNIISGNYDNPVIRSIPSAGQSIPQETTCVQVTDDGIVAGTERGMLEFYPNRLKIDSQLNIPIYFTSVEHNGINDTTILYSSAKAGPKFSYDENVISFEFTGVNLKDENSTVYRYKLEGQDNKWTYSGSRNFVSYNLQPGNYRFMVQAGTTGGQWSNETAIYSFVIKQPFWTTAWFILLCLFVIIGSVYTIYQFRLRQALKIERLRSRISTDLHDDIGSTLSSISILSNLALEQEQSNQSKNMMEEIKTNAISLMEKMDDIVWSINPEKDSINELMLRIKRFASRLFEAREIDYAFNIDQGIKGLKLDMEKRQHIYLIMKEAINNMVKYADCTQALIDASYDAELLKITISDNGKGFDIDRETTGNGILNMKRRAAVLNGELYIDSTQEKGTSINLNVKIK